MKAYLLAVDEASAVLIAGARVMLQPVGGVDLLLQQLFEALPRQCFLALNVFGGAGIFSHKSRVERSRSSKYETVKGILV